MNIEIWSDFACPFCYIGKHIFEQALEQFPHKEDVKIVFKSFKLDPNALVHEEHDVHDMLVGKSGMKREEAIAMNHNIGVQAAQSGLDFQFDAIQLTNTFDAHRLAKYADQQGKAAIFQDLFKAYFMAKPKEFYEDGNTIIVVGVYSGTYKLTGNFFEADFVHIWRVENGKIVRFKQYVDSHLVQASMLSK